MPNAAAADTGDETVDKLATNNAGVLDEVRARLRLCMDADGDNHEQGLNDLKFLGGDQWDERARKQRELDGRPCLTINKLPTFLHQVTNDQRQNVPSIKVSPVDDHADVKTAEIIQGMIRHMEYSSNADVAYDTAVNSAAAIGFGYFRLVTDFCSPESFDQDIKFKRIRNPFTVYFDPGSEEPDGSDAQFVIITSKMSRAEFKREYPKAEANADSNMSVGAGDPWRTDWLGKDFVRVAEYYRVVMQTATLIELSNGESGWKDQLIDMPEGVTIARERQSARKTIEWKKVTGLDVLEETVIKCDWIPVFPVYGDELDIDGKVVRAGLIRNAKDPARAYNYWMTAATEEVALRTKTPFIGAEGQFEGFEDDWNQANVRSFPYMEYKPVTLDGTLAPPPQRQQMADIPSGMLAMALHANDNIKATTGLFDSSLGDKGNATSGIQERAQQRQGDIANYHFTDNLMRSIRQAGRCIISMIPYYYDTKRVVRILGEDGAITHETVNEPVDPTQVTEQQQELMSINNLLHDLTVGEYDVTVKAGASYDTLRQEAVEQMIELGGKWPKLMDTSGDIIVGNMDFKGSQEAAARLKKTLPPGLADTDDEQGPVVQTAQGPVPVEQAAQMLAEAQQQVQALDAALQEAQAGIPVAQINADKDLQKAQLEAESRERVAQISAEASKDVAELKGMVTLLVEKMQPPPELESAVDEDLGEEGGEAGADKPDAMQALLQHLALQSRPTRKVISITAPSGLVYTGEIADEPQDEQPTMNAEQVMS